MKKLFISCPMKGRTEENIKKSMEQMHKLAEIYFDQELEVIPSYTKISAPKGCNKAVWYLGRSIQMMSEADFFIGVNYTDFFKGCMVERDAARAYGIRNISVDIHELMPDALEVERKHWEEISRKTCTPSC